MGEQSVNFVYLNWSDRLSLVAAEAITEGQTLYASADGTVSKYADGEQYLGIALVAAASGDEVTVVTDGYVRINKDSHGLTAGDPVYATGTGDIAGAPANGDNRIGVVVDASVVDGVSGVTVKID